MNFFIRTKGSVSIFLVIIMVPVIVVCTIFIDVSRIKLAQGLATSSADLALNSVLTQYDTELADYYGLMASCQDIDSFYEVAENYFEFCMVSQGISTLDAQKWSKTLMDVVAGGGDINDLIQIDTENTEATIEPVANATLANPNVLKAEIIDFMKYRAPIELIGALDTKNGFVSKLTAVQEQIEMVPHETRIQNEKIEYYNAENELLKKANDIYWLLKDYEAQKYDGMNYPDDTYLEQIRKDMKSDSETDRGLEETYKELHKKYVSYWANTKDYTTAFVSVESYLTANGNRSISDGKKSATTIKNAISNCKTKRSEYETAKTAMQTKLNNITFAMPAADRTINKVQYWVQMDKAMKANNSDTYDKYVKALAALRTAILDMQYAYDNREEGSRTISVHAKDPITGAYLYTLSGDPVMVPDTETYDINTDAYDDNSTIKEAYESEKGTADSVLAGRVNEKIYRISANMQTYSEEALEAKLTDRTLAGQEIAAAVVTLKTEYEFLVTLQDKLQLIINEIPDLLELVESYKSAFDTWAEDAEAHHGQGSDLIDTDYDEVRVIKGELSADAAKGSADMDAEQKGQYSNALVSVDIDVDEVNAFQARLQNTIDLIQSYRDTIESIRYHGTTIIGKGVSNKVQTSDEGIDTFVLFEDAATAQRNGCTTPVVKTDEIPVYQDGEDGLDAYIEKTWDIADALDSITEVTPDNTPKLHDYANWKTQASPDIDSFDAWLHHKFDTIDKIAAEVDVMLKDIFKLIKNIADSALNDFGTFDNPYISAQSYSDFDNLPSNGASDLIKADENGNDVEESDDVTAELNSSSGVTSLFDKFDFGALLTDGRDNLYTLEYIMDMFTYETQALETIYEQAREGVDSESIYAVKVGDSVIDIGPGNAETLYDGYLKEDDATWWTDTDKTLTYNKTLTNKMLDKKNNYSFGNEVEYIMFGGDTDESKSKMHTTLYFLRYALNLAPVMAYYWSDKTVMSIASSISAATGGIIPVPLIKAVICLGVCAGEAAVDQNYLKAGLPVLFFKKKDQLFIKLELDADSFAGAVQNSTEYTAKAVSKTNVTITKSTGGESDSGKGMLFSYSDYLSIFLYIQLCVAEDNVYKRVADVIQINMSKNPDLPEYTDNFEMVKSLTYFNITADVRVKPLMLALPYSQQMGADALDMNSWNTFTTEAMTRGY